MGFHDEVRIVEINNLLKIEEERKLHFAITLNLE